MMRLFRTRHGSTKRLGSGKGTAVVFLLRHEFVPLILCGPIKEGDTRYLEAPFLFRETRKRGYMPDRNSENIRRYSPLATDLTAREVNAQRTEAARDFH